MAESSTTWRVVSQTETLGPGPDNRFGKGIEIMIETGLGHRGSQFIPQSQYAPERVKPLLASLAKRLDDVSRLSG